MKLTKEGCWWRANDVKIINEFTEEQAKEILEAFLKVDKEKLKPFGTTCITLIGHKLNIYQYAGGSYGIKKDERDQDFH